jgi:hypothetical protein
MAVILSTDRTVCFEVYKSYVVSFFRHGATFALSYLLASNQVIT